MKTSYHSQTRIKPTLRSKLGTFLCTVLSLLQVLLPTIAAALPSEGQVVGGQAVIQQSSTKSLQVQQGTDKAILNWKSFSIAADEAVHFSQPAVNSIALNRVIGTDPSVILGRLQSNGRIFLINPNGVLFGAGAQINVGSLLATTLQIRDEDFMAGRFLFAQDPLKPLRTVINRAEIKISDHGFVFLVAPGIANEGLIVANLGTTVLGSGQKLTLDLMGDGLINYAVSEKVLAQVTGPDGKPFSSAVSNTGTIQADGGQVLLSAKASGDIFSSVVNQSGVIRAQSLVNHGGVVRLEGSDPVANTGTLGWQANLGKVQNAEGKVLNTGTIDVSAAEPGAAQGQVTLSGEMVGVAGAIVARGAEGAQGGRVLISSTDKTVATTDSIIDTSGVGNSSAGNVVIWSDMNTMFGGRILAKGGGLGGNGGQIEVSGHKNLGFFGQANALAPNGTTGTLLLDPLNITVATGGGATLAQVDQFADTPGTNQTIAPATINAAAANVTLQANNDITVTNPIAMTNNGVGITMQAGRDINVNAGVSTTNGNISLTANDSTATAANRTAGTTGDIVFGAAGDLSAGSGNITMTVGSSAAAPFSPGSITNARNVTTTAGNIAINSPNTVSLSGAVNAGSGTVVINANTDGAGAQGFAMNAGSSITTTNTGTNALRIVVNSPTGGTGAASLRGNIVTGNGGTATVSTRGQAAAGGNTTGGQINQSAAVTMNTGAGGTVAFATGGSTADVNLNTVGNDFTGSVEVSRARNVTLRDANQLNLGTSTILGNFTVNAGNAVTQTGALSSTGGASTLAVTTLNNAGAPITLTNANNNFVNINLSARNAANTANGPGAIAYRDVNAVNVTQLRTTSTVDLIAGGPITDSGTLTGSTLTATTLNNAGAAITLDTATNNFATINLRARNATDTADANGALTYRDTNGFDVAALQTTNNAVLRGNGAITDSGNLVVGGATTIVAGAGNDITLNNAGNNFNTLSITSGRNITIVDSNGLNLGTSTVSGTLNIAANGAITDSGNVVVTGVTTLAAGAGNNITLDSAGNNFSTVSITNGNTVTVRDTNALVLGASTVSGALNVTTNGALTQSGALNVTGTTTLAAGAANDITLNNAANNFSTVGITSGRNVTLRDTNALNLGASTVSGALNVTTNGALTQSGALAVTGTTTLAAGAANNITLNNAGNNFSTVGITSGNNIALTDANALILGASTVSGTLNVTANGALTQTGALTVAGTATLAAGGANNITLNNAGNNFSTVSVNSGNTVALRDANTLILGASTVSGALNVTTNGALTQSGALNVTGTTTLAAGAANDITLNNAANNFSTVGITSGRNVTLRDTNALNLGASTVSGALNVTTNGPITDSGNVVVTGVTTLAAGAGNNITLDSAGNNFSTVGITNGNNVTVRDTNALVLGGSTVSGALNVTTNGALTQSGALNVTGTTTLAAGAANDITLNNAANDFGTLAVMNARNVTLQDANALDLGASTVSGGLNMTTHGALTQSGALTVAGAMTVAAGIANDVTLNNAANNFSTVSVTSGRNVTLRDAADLTLGTSTASGTFSVTAGGAILDGDGAGVNVTATTATFNTGTAVGTVADPVETSVGTLNAATTSGGIFLSEADAVRLGSVVASGGNIAINNATGNMTINNVTAMTGSVDLIATGGSILSGGGPGPNLTAAADSTLQAMGGVVGTLAVPISVHVNPGSLGIRATQQIGGISGALTGTVLPSSTLTLLGVPPGLVLFNGNAAGNSPGNTFLFFNGIGGLLAYLNPGVIVPAYYQQPSGAAGLTMVASTYMPGTAVAAADVSVSGDNQSVARVIPPCMPESSCVPGASFATASVGGPESSESAERISRSGNLNWPCLSGTDCLQDNGTVVNGDRRAQSDLSLDGEPVTLHDDVMVASIAPMGTASRPEVRKWQELLLAGAGLDSVRFEFESWHLDENTFQDLTRIADWLRAHPTTKLTIEGHCDERGSDGYNLLLGLKRAKAVQTTLIDLDVSADRLSVVSFGKMRPLCTEQTAACYHQNRRGYLLVNE